MSVGLHRIYERGKKVSVKVPPVMFGAATHRYGKPGSVRQFSD